jgi:5'-nucleotidase
MAGDFIMLDKGEDTDEWAIKNNYVSVVPCQYDMTAHFNLTALNNDWDLE